MRLLIVYLLIHIPIRRHTLSLVSILLSCCTIARIVTHISTYRHLMAANARTVIRLCLFESSLMALAGLTDLCVRRWLNVRLAEGQLLVTTVALCRIIAYGSEVGATIAALSHLLLLML